MGSGLVSGVGRSGCFQKEKSVRLIVSPSYIGADEPFYKDKANTRGNSICTKIKVV